MRFAPLVRRECKARLCNKSWRTLPTSKWKFCSRSCAIEAGAITKGQDFRDYLSAKFGGDSQAYIPKKRGEE